MWCFQQDTAGNRMKGFKLLLQAAEAGDRSSMITVARAFDDGINLSADRLVVDGALLALHAKLSSV